MSAVSAFGGLRRRIGIGGLIALGFLLLLVLVAVLAGLIAPHDPNTGDILNSYAPADGTHWLGTDINGRDIASRLIVGTRTSLLGPAGVILMSLIVGVPIALAGVWFGGRIDFVIARVMDVIFAMPGILLAVLTVAVFHRGLLPAMIAIAVSYLPYVARIVRSAALQQRNLSYVAALEVQGVSGFRICTRHILPNISGLVIAQSTLAFGYALSDLAALSFLGLAVQGPDADWGVLVNDSGSLRNGHSAQVLMASLLIVATIVSLTLLGDRLTEGNPLVHRLRLRKRPAAVTAPAAVVEVAK